MAVEIYLDMEISWPSLRTYIPVAFLFHFCNLGSLTPLTVDFVLSDLSYSLAIFYPQAVVFRASGPGLVAAYIWCTWVDWKINSCFSFFFNKTVYYYWTTHVLPHIRNQCNLYVHRELNLAPNRNSLTTLQNKLLRFAFRCQLTC